MNNDPGVGGTRLSCCGVVDDHARRHVSCVAAGDVWALNRWHSVEGTHGNR
jgi:hypothetical protein